MPNLIYIGSSNILSGVEEIVLVTVLLWRLKDFLVEAWCARKIIKLFRLQTEKIMHVYYMQRHILSPPGCLCQPKYNQ